ncbi:MAG: PAS domain S-box protein [Syntrophobacteraceae bacterium]
MELVERLTAEYSTSRASTSPRIFLDPDEARREQQKKSYRHHVYEIPTLRAFGLSLITLYVLLHNLYVIPTPSAWTDFWHFLVVCALYSGVSWLILLACYGKVTKVNLGSFFLLGDIIVFLLAIYYSGGEKSWLFFLLMVRTADQTRTTWRKTLLFANVSAGGYVLLLVYLGYFEHRALSLPAELTIICFIYASNVYLSFVAKTSEYLRHRMTEAIHVSRDLIQRLEAQSSALKASERDYRALIEGSIQGIFIRQERAIQLANPAFARIFGYESPDELIGLDCMTLAAPHERDRLEGYLAALGEGLPNPERFEHMGVRRDGTFVWIECLVSHIMWGGAPAVLATLQDITARREAEEVLQQAHSKLEARVEERTAELQLAIEALRIEIAERMRTEEERQRLAERLQQTQKLEAIGTLAGGIAHDFNNILGIIMGYGELVALELPEKSAGKERLGEVLKAADRAKDLVRQILIFGRAADGLKRRPMDILPVIKQSLKFLRASLPTTIEINQHISTNGRLISGHPTQIHQVLTNLCTNAAHAMEEKFGVLEVSLTDVALTSGTIPPYSDMKPGPCVRLTVKDTGKGMDSATLARIFDPYFTTKEVGKGTGLGLAIVHGIVKGYGGAISVHSEIGRGTTFDVYLPTIDSELIESDETNSPIPGGTERILFIDDEAPLVELWDASLKRLGYKIMTATNGMQALEFFQTHPDAFDLVMTDYTMPKMTGIEVAEQMMRTRPNIPVVLCTGRMESTLEERARKIGIRSFLTKPLELHNAARVIREVLDTKPTNGTQPQIS